VREVALHRRAWIEIVIVPTLEPTTRSLSIGERGLKYIGPAFTTKQLRSLSIGERGLKFTEIGYIKAGIESLSIGERGLKYVCLCL